MFFTLALALPADAADKKLINFTRIVTKYLDQTNASSIPVLLDNFRANLDDLNEAHSDDYRSMYKQALKASLAQKSLRKSLVKLRSEEIAYLQSSITKQKLKNLKIFLRKNRRLNAEEKLQVEEHLENIYSLMQADLEIIEEEIATTQTSLLQNPNNAGVYGMTSLIYGDCMPKSEGSPNTCFEEAKPMKITIRKPATIDDLEDFIYLGTKPELLMETVSDENGFFEIDIEPGQYSIFVDDNGREYCNSFSPLGYACLVEISTSKKILRNLLIDHAFW